MKHDLEGLKNLIRFMNEHGLVELEVADESEHVRLRRPEVMEAIPIASSEKKTADAPAPEMEKAAKPEPSTVGFAAPMVGTLHLAGEDDVPFVKVGDKVSPKTVICVIEAMAVPNEVRANVKGTVAEILAKDGQPLEFGTPLFRFNIIKDK